MAGDKSFYEQTSTSLELSVGKQAQGLGDTANKASEIASNDNLSTSTKATAQAVNAVDAGVQAFGAITGLADSLTEAAIMPILGALGMKGIAALPISKQLDPVIGIDVHMVVYPPVPAPVPLPHPYIGMLFRPKDFVAAAAASFLPPPPAPPAEGEQLTDAQQKEATKNQALNVGHALATIAIGMIGATVKIGGFIPRAVAGTPSKNIPHFPLAPAFHPAFSAAVAKNHGHALFGSLLALADNDPISGGGAHLHNDCWDVGILSPHTLRPSKNTSKEIKIGAKLYLPTGMIMPIPMAKSIITSPVPAPFNPMAMLQKALMGAFGRHFRRLKKKAARKMHDKVNGKIKSKKLNRALHKAICTVTGHPVDVASGMFFTDEEDFHITGPIPLAWERTWYSKSDYRGPLGNGWHHSYDLALIVEDGIASLRMQDGRPIAFELPRPGRPSPNIAEQLELRKSEEGEYYVWNIKEEVFYHFTEESYNDLQLLRSIVSANGFSIRFGYDRKGHLTAITDSAHRQLEVQNDARGRITRITAPHPVHPTQRTVVATYVYDGEGNMVQQTNAAGDSMHFEYQGRLMVKETWRNGLNWYFEYDGAGIGSRCVHTWGDGGIYNHRLTFYEGRTHVENSLGHTTEYHHKNGLVHRKVDPNGGEEQWLYGGDNLLRAYVDPVGNKTLHGYDGAGNRVQTTNPMGGSLMLEHEPRGDHPHLPVKAKDANGGTWQWKYDAHGNVTERTDPMGATTKNTYRDGLLHTITDPLGMVTTLSYDEEYNIGKVTDGLGNTTTYEYDLLGRCTRATNPRGAVQERTFDDLGRVTRVKDYDGNRIELAYDGIDNLVSYRDAHQKVRYRYRGMWKLAERSDARGTVHYRYDTEEQLTEITNERHVPYRFHLDPAGHVVKETGFDQGHTHYARDLAGRVTELRDPMGRSTRYAYDRGGNIAGVTYHDGQTHTFAHNPAGQLVRAVNKDAEVTFGRNVLGLVETETVNGHSIAHSYDPVGRRTGLESSMGARLQFAHDDFGNLAGLTASRGGAQWRAQYKHDSLGFELERHLPGKLTQNFSYDRIGRLTGHVTRRDKKHRHNRRYTWGVNDRLQRVDDSGHGTTEYAYGPTGHLRHARFGDGSEQYRVPDAVGNLHDGPGKGGRRYGHGGRLEKKGPWRYRYDGNGSLIEKSKGGGGWLDDRKDLWKYKWNAAGMLETVTRPDKHRVHFTYDALGRRLSKTFRGTTTRWLWDGNVPLHEWKENQNGQILSNSTVGDDGIITWVFEENSFIPTAKLKGDKKYSILADHLGTPTHMYDGGGALTWERELDINGRAKHGGSGSCPFLFQGQYYDPEIELAYNRHRYYDPNDGRYISKDPIGLLSGEYGLYNYVDDPNGWVDVFGLNKNSNSAVGDWVLYEVKDPDTGIAKIGIGKAEDVMADGTNRRAHTSARKVRKDLDFENARARVLSTHEGITKGEMKEIEAKKVRDLRSQGHELPHNRERDKRYQPGYEGKK